MAKASLFIYTASSVWSIVGVILVCVAIYSADMFVGCESFTSLLNMVDSTSYHQSAAAIVAAEPTMRAATVGTRTTYSTLANPKYAYADETTGQSLFATAYTGLPDSATFSSAKPIYVPDYAAALALSRNRGV
jgi:hypothetical protein